MHVRHALLTLLAAALLAGCAVDPTPPRAAVALLAPFEGRYREVGYAALYPARLALADAGTGTLDLLPVDDGGSVESAVERARALVIDARVKAVIVVGYTASSDAVQQVFDTMPVIIAGDWGARPARPNTFILSNPRISAELASAARFSVTTAAQRPAPLLGGDVLGLEGFRKLRDDLDGVTLLTSASPIDDDFHARILASDRFAVEPDHLAGLVYDAVGMTAAVLINNVQMDRAQAALALADLRYEGYSGTISFDSGGYWEGAPINALIYDDSGALVLAD
ncbi:MAG: ABC transporter substrate-binding protein [Chloroflexota bacterium]